MENKMLPKIDLPLYEITLPVIDKKVKIRPFTVKENKILLMALEGNDPNQIILAIKQIVNNCVVSPNFDVDQLGFYNVEFLILNLRACSISETITLQFEGKENSNCKSCKLPISYDLNLNDVKVQIPENYNKKFTLKCGLVVVMKEPTYESVNKLKVLTDAKSGIDQFFEFTADSIECVADENNVYNFAEVSKGERIKFVESLSMPDFELIQTFFSNLPTLRHVIELKCPECQTQKTAILEGVDDFLG